MNKLFIYDSLKSNIFKNIKNNTELNNYFKNCKINHGYIKINNKKLKMYGIIICFHENINNILDKFLELNKKYTKVEEITCYDLFNHSEIPCFILL